MNGTTLKAFSSELQKLAAEARITPQASAKAAAHFEAQDKDWKRFEKYLKSPAFRSAIAKAEQADPKLRKYVKTFGAYQGSKDELARIKSKDTGNTYIIKDLHNGRWGCNCKDWQFSRSINGGDCKHIKSVKASKMVKQSAAASVGQMLGMGATLTTKANNRYKSGAEVSKTVKEISPWANKPLISKRDFGLH